MPDLFDTELSEMKIWCFKCNTSVYRKMGSNSFISKQGKQDLNTNGNIMIRTILLKCQIRENDINATSDYYYYFYSKHINLNMLPKLFKIRH